MLWAILVAGGVAVVSMTIFAARLTRQPALEHAAEDDFVPAADPSDPWAAWKPRSFDELDRPRPRMWPLIGALTGLVLVGAGLAGARQTLWATTAAPTTGYGPVAQVTSHPDLVSVEVTEAPTPPPTPVPTPEPTIRPLVQTAAPTLAPKASQQATTSGPGPSISGSASCGSGKLAFSYTVTAGGSNLSWLAVYADGKVAKGGPISGTSHSGTYSQAATSGDHALEVSVQDKAGHTSRKQYQAHCA